MRLLLLLTVPALCCTCSRAAFPATPEEPEEDGMAAARLSAGTEETGAGGSFLAWESLDGEVALSGRPYLMATEADFDNIARKAADPASPKFAALQAAVLERAGTYADDETPLTYALSAGRLLAVSREALERIFYLAYAWRTTGEGRYLARAERLLNQVCSFPDWAPAYYLDVSEMALAVAFGYDWLYDSLQEDTRTAVETALRSRLLETARGPYGLAARKRNNNWSQVCNAAAVCAAIALDGPRSDTARGFVGEAVRYLVDDGRLDAFYGPDGIYPEGPGYWDYGTSCQVILNGVLDHAYGTDFGMGATEGFDQTGRFISFCNGSKKRFHFSDNSAPNAFPQALWYFGWKSAADRDLLEPLTRNPVLDRFQPAFMLYAARLDEADIRPRDAGLFFAGGGEQPLFIARTGWDAASLYLGAKGGRPSLNHGHMDTGSFVFDAYGVRWSGEPPCPGYAASEARLKALGKNLWLMDQDSWRWKILGYSPWWHSVIMVDGADFDVDGQGTLEETFDTDAARGGTFDLTAAYGGRLGKARRTLLVRDGAYLEITDVLQASPTAPAAIDWHIWSEAVPAADADGITLTGTNGVRMRLQTTGAAVTYRTLSTDPADYGPPYNQLQDAPSGRYLAGFTLTLPAGETVSLVTTLKKI